MQPWEELASAETPGGTRLSLWRRGDETVIRAGSAVLMSSRQRASEELLATHGCADLGARPSVLIGGLGMGFTLRAALRMLPDDAAVVVAEIAPAVVAWVRGPLGAAALLDDPRVAVEVRPVGDVLAEARSRFDAVLLDVDNGPVALVDDDNARLYDAAGVARIAASLRPGGRVAVWSAGEHRSFLETLARAGLEARSIAARARGADGGARHAILLARKATSTPRDPDPRSRAAPSPRPRGSRTRTRGPR
jgi:spermidine synthase